MHKKITDKKILALESFFEPILICNNKKLKPHSEILIQEAENVTQKSLGTLVGVFEMMETSEESSYIVNYIISVIKKEYFSNPKRAPLESFEAALHKGNLALSKLAEHGHIKWIGKLNAVVAIFEKNNLHLSQAGTASTFLLRGKTLTDISEGLASHESQNNPLKTFVNISSGRMENGDRLIIATEGIFDIFSSEELKKNALRFSYEEFVRFLKTALSNELERAAVLVADIQEKKEAELKKEMPARESFNAFSQASFIKSKPAASNQKPLDEELREKQATSSPQKNGHIYIKESETLAEPKKPIADYWKNASDCVFALKEKTAASLKSSGSSLKGKIIRSATNLSLPKIPKISLNKKEELEKTPSIIETRPDTSFPPEKPAARKQFATMAKNLGTRMSKINAALSLTKSTESAKKIFLTGKNMFLRFMPSLTRLKNSLINLDPQQRKYALTAVLMIFFLPLIFIKTKNYIQEKNRPAPEPVATPLPDPLEQDKNLTRLKNLDEVSATSNLVGLINLNGKIFLVSQKEITDMENQQTFAIPDDFGKTKLASGMNDLGLIFIINENNAIISLSPTSRKFQTNNINIPANANLISAKSYLTYLYLLDTINNQIYRYPRATGGFGEKIDWLKDAANLSQTKDMFVGESIFIADDLKILKFFRGKKQELSLEDSITPIIADKVFVSENESIYALDQANSRIVRWDANGDITTQYYHLHLKDFTDLVIDESKNLIYLSDSNKVVSFSIN